MDTLSTPNFSSPAFDIVGLGASFGGIEALSLLLSVLPPEFPLPIVIVQHIAPYYRSYLDEVLGYRTPLRVQKAGEGEPLQGGMVYTASPDRHLIITPERTFSLVDSPRVNYARPSINPLFHSIAMTYQERAIGIVLTGANGDGADGIRAIRKSGGITIAQDKATSQAFKMPQSAIDTNCINFVLPIDKIALALIALTMVEGTSAFFTLPTSARYPLTA